MYKKKEFYQLFRSVPLPFNVFTFPESGSHPPVHLNTPLFFTHKMTTDLTLNLFQECGFQQGTNAMICHILIGRSFSDPQLQTINDFQKCCHFSSTFLMGTKSELHNRMKELSQRLGTRVPYYPQSYYPPDDYEELVEAWPTRKYWIIKAPALSRAREIRVASSKDEKPPILPYVVEEYITPPYLITGRKFDIRLYALVTSINPMTIYFHRQGLALFATHEYKNVNETNLNDLQMHLTNYEINKNSEMFKECQGTDEKVENSKWSLPFLWKYFDGIGIDSNKLRSEIEDVSTSAIIACMCSIRNAQSKNVKHHRKSSFEFVGVDILLDENLKPYLLEINISPSMAGTSKLDEKIKLEVAHDLYNIVRILDVSSLRPKECMGYFEYEQEYFRCKNKNEKIVTQKVDHNEGNFLNNVFNFLGEMKDSEEKCNDVIMKREDAVVKGHLNPWNSPTFADYTIIREFIDEQERSRGFHRAYPKRKNIKKFEKCFDAYNYEDIVLNEWLLMDKRKRFETLIENFDMYYMCLQKCCRIRDECTLPEIIPPKKSEEEKSQINENEKNNNHNLNEEVVETADNKMKNNNEQENIFNDSNKINDQNENELINSSEADADVDESNNNINTDQIIIEKKEGNGCQIQ